VAGESGSPAKFECAVGAHRALGSWAEAFFPTRKLSRRAMRSSRLTALALWGRGQASAGGASVSGNRTRGLTLLRVRSNPRVWWNRQTPQGASQHNSVSFAPMLDWGIEGHWGVPPMHWRTYPSEGPDRSGVGRPMSFRTVVSNFFRKPSECATDSRS
jgi:hypothetical protein